MRRLVRLGSMGSSRRFALLGLVVLMTAWARPAFPERDHGAVLEAVLLYQVWQFAGTDAAEMPICLAVAAGDDVIDPSQAFLKRVRQKADVRPVSQCSTSRTGVTTADGIPAMDLGVGPINWLADDEAQVRGRYFRTANASARPLYRVVFEKGRWRCLGPVIEGVPL
jgi:hypothetical protein